MKYVLIIIVVVGIAAYLSSRMRPKLVATITADEKISLWGESTPEKKKLIESAYQQTKDLLVQTAIARKKSRGDMNPPKSTVVYVVHDKTSFFIFADDYPFKAPELEVVGDSRKTNCVEFNLLNHSFSLKIAE